MQREQLVQMPSGWGVLGYATGIEQTVWLGEKREMDRGWLSATLNPGVRSTQKNQRSFAGTLSVCSAQAQLSPPSVAS